MDKIEDIKHRHNTLKNYLDNRNWDKNPHGKLIEFDLMRDVAKTLEERMPDLKKFVYLYDYEWEAIPGRTDKNKGDLVFTDGKNNFLIVECKLKDSNYVRQQVLSRIKDFKQNHSDLNKIYGLAMSRGDWDYLDENENWHYERMDKNVEFFRTYDNLDLNLNQMEAKCKLQEYYKSIGYKPTDPTSALNQLKQISFLSMTDNYDSLENKPPFQIVINARLIKKYNKPLDGKGEASNKNLARVLASADICEQIFLEYDMSIFNIPIEKIEKGEYYHIREI